MIKAYCISKYLGEDNKRVIADTCEKYGYDVTFFENSAEASGNVSDAEAAYCNRPELLCQMSRLKWCHADSAGVEKYIQTGMFNDPSVILTNSSGAFGKAIAEYIIMVALMLLRRMPEYEKITGSRQWKHDLPIRSIAGSNIVIIGTGDIGRRAAANFKALGAASVTGFNRSGRPVEYFDKTYRIDEFTARAAQADVAVMCVPSTPDTDKLLDADMIAALPDSAYVINVGRGATVDQEALTRALNDGRIAGAALDVFQNEPVEKDSGLWDTENLLITPHISGNLTLQYTRERNVEIFLDQLERYCTNKELINVVDCSLGY